MAGPTTAMIAGQTKLLRDLLRAEAENHGMRVTGDVIDLTDAVLAARTQQPEVVIIEAPHHDGWMEALIGLKEAGCAVLVVTDDSSPEQVVELLSAGVDGVLCSDSSTSEVVMGAKLVAGGGVALSEDIASLLLHQWRALRGVQTPLVSGPRTALTQRELDVLVAMAEGLSTKAIARKLGVALKTVENHKTRVYQKLGARTNAHAISMAIRLGLLRPQSSTTD